MGTFFIGSLLLVGPTVPFDVSLLPATVALSAGFTLVVPLGFPFGALFLSGTRDFTVGFGVFSGIQIHLMFSSSGVEIGSIIICHGCPEFFQGWLSWIVPSLCQLSGCMDGFGIVPGSSEDNTCQLLAVRQCGI